MRRQWSAPRSNRFNPGETTTGLYPVNKKLGGLQRRFGHFSEEKSSGPVNPWIKICQLLSRHGKVPEHLVVTWTVKKFPAVWNCFTEQLTCPEPVLRYWNPEHTCVQGAGFSLKSRQSNKCSRNILLVRNPEFRRRVMHMGSTLKQFRLVTLCTQFLEVLFWHPSPKHTHARTHAQLPRTLFPRGFLFLSEDITHVLPNPHF